jgi:hypothetical protein
MVVTWGLQGGIGYKLSMGIHRRGGGYVGQHSPYSFLVK